MDAHLDTTKMNYRGRRTRRGTTRPRTVLDHHIGPPSRDARRSVPSPGARLGAMRSEPWTAALTAQCATRATVPGCLAAWLPHCLRLSTSGTYTGSYILRCTSASSASALGTSLRDIFVARPCSKASSMTAHATLRETSRMRLSLGKVRPDAISSAV